MIESGSGDVLGKVVGACTAFIEMQGVDVDKESDSTMFARSNFGGGANDRVAGACR